MNMLEFGMRGHDIPTNDLEILTKTACENKISHFQLALKKTFPDIYKKTGIFSPGLAAKIKKGLDSADLRVSVLGSYINPVAEDEEARKAELDFYLENVKFAAFLGAGCIGTETGTNGDSAHTHSEENYRLFLKSAEKMVDTCENFGIIAGFEPVSVFTIDSPKTAARMIKDLASPNIGIIFDPVNMLSSETYENQEYIIKEAIELLHDRIVAVHLKDFDYENGRRAAKRAGEGKADFKTVLKYIKYEKPGVDMVLDETPLCDIPHTIKYLTEIWNEI